jgi:hypothetical protein
MVMGYGLWVIEAVRSSSFIHHFFIAQLESTASTAAAEAAATAETAEAAETA